MQTYWLQTAWRTGQSALLLASLSCLCAPCICTSLHLLMFLSIYLSFFLSIFLFVYLSSCFSIFLCFHLSIYLSICVSICLCVYLSVFVLSICPFIYLSVRLSTHLFCLPICVLSIWSFRPKCKWKEQKIATTKPFCKSMQIYETHCKHAS